MSGRVNDSTGGGCHGRDNDDDEDVINETTALLLGSRIDEDARKKRPSSTITDREREETNSKDTSDTDTAITKDRQINVK